MDGEGRTNSLSLSMSSPETCDSFLSVILKDQVFHEVIQNVSDLETKIRHAISSITEETFQNVFQNTLNRLSFVLCYKAYILNRLFGKLKAINKNSNMYFEPLKLIFFTEI